jgi:hypothetical protein
LAVFRQGQQPQALDESFRNAGVRFNHNFALASLRLDDAGEGDERVVYSRISSVQRL